MYGTIFMCRCMYICVSVGVHGVRKGTRGKGEGKKEIITLLNVCFCFSKEISRAELTGFSESMRVITAFWGIKGRNFAKISIKKIEKKLEL